MNKEINELDRMIIGVREWAIQTAVGDPFIDRNLAKGVREGGSTKELLKVAGELEEFVIREIGKEKS